EGHELLVVRKRPREPLHDPVVEGEGEDERGNDCEERDDEPRSELVQVLDERRLLAVIETAREPPTSHRGALLADGLALRLRLARRARNGGGGRELDPCRCRSRRCRSRRSGRILVTRDGVLELTHALPERAPHLGQPLRAENEEKDDQEDEQLG